jgi:hypothetical protein
MSDEGEGLDVKMGLIDLKNSPNGLWKEMATALIAVITAAEAESHRCQGAEADSFIHLSDQFLDIRDARTLRGLRVIMAKYGLMERWKRVKLAN